MTAPEVEHRCRSRSGRYDRFLAVCRRKTCTTDICCGRHHPSSPEGNRWSKAGTAVNMTAGHLVTPDQQNRNGIVHLCRRYQLPDPTSFVRHPIGSNRKIRQSVPSLITIKDICIKMEIRADLGGKNVFIDRVENCASSQDRVAFQSRIPADVKKKMGKMNQNETLLCLTEYRCSTEPPYSL